MVPSSKTAELRDLGFCVIDSHFPKSRIEALRETFAPTLSEYLETHRDAPNRGPNRHFLPMPFDRPSLDFFFDETILQIVRHTLGNRIVADQWGCDVPLEGSTHQQLHADYQRPLFEELPDLPLPAYMLIVSFGLVDITLENGPLEIAPGTHRTPGTAATELQPILLSPGDVLIRHPWALHRGTPNRTPAPRPLCTIRYVRRWYADSSRDVFAIPQALWDSLALEQRSILRFPTAGSII